MATLEVHDAQNRVQFIELERDHPILFGTSVHCEVILEGPGIKPVHGRIRWKRGRFKVEASPDAEYVLINGHKIANGSIDVGDEISIGPCRIFLLRMDEAAPAGQRARGAAAAEGRTMVAPPPIPGSAGHGDRGRPGDSPPVPLKRSRYVRPGDMPAARPDWAREMAAGRTSSPAIDNEEGKPAVRPGLKARFARALRNWLPEDVAPGQESIVSSPLVVSLLLLLAVLVGMGFWLKAIIAATVAERTFHKAMEDFEQGDYRTAIRDFDAFVAANPEDPRAPKARVMRSLANIRQYVSPNGSTWTSALDAARAMQEEFAQGGGGAAQAFRDEHSELAELVLRIGEGLADRARGTADPKALAEAESTVPLHAAVAGEPARALLTKSRLPTKLADARAAVRKSQVRTRLLAAMDQALADGSATRVYQGRDSLVEQYADLAQDKDLIKRMTAANELIRKGVTVDRTRKAAEHAPRPESLGAPTSLVLRSRTEPASASPAPESIVYALADGIGYGIEATSGAPLWQVPLGLASPFVPQVVPGAGAVIAFDARSGELVRLDARTGALAWRLELAERVADPPLVLGNQLVQVLPSGKVMLISLETGDLQATLNLGRPLARTAVSDESGRHLYVLGRQDSLFVLNRDPLGCAAVEYLGHADGSIPCAPALVGRYFIIPENDTLADSKWHVFVLDEEGTKIKPAQDLQVLGWTWQTPTVSGQFVWTAGDRAAFEAFAVGEYTSKTPFRSVAKMTPDANQTGPAFALARSEREMWAASGHSGRYKLDPEHGSIQASPMGAPGPAKAPIQVAGNVLVATFQDRDLGGTALLGIEPESATVAWKTVLGSSWPTDLAPSDGSAGLSTLGRDGREVLISPEQAARGGFVVLPVPRPGAFALPAGLRLRLDRESSSGGRGSVRAASNPGPSGGRGSARAASDPGPHESSPSQAHTGTGSDGASPSRAGGAINLVVPRPYSKSLWVQDASQPGGWRELTLPATVAAEPVVWQGGVLIPGADARVYLIDPVTGRSIAEPFVPQFDRDHQGTFLGPAILDGDTVILADDVGRVRRLSLKTTPVPRLVMEAERSLDSRIVADPTTTGAAVLVATADGQVRSLAARDLSPVGAWPLDASIAGRPVGLGDGALALDRGGGVLAFGRDGQKTWSIKLGAEVVGAPLLAGRSLVILTSDGMLHVRARADGAPMERRPLGVLPAGGPITMGTDAMIPVAPGTIRPVRP